MQFLSKMEKREKREFAFLRQIPFLYIYILSQNRKKFKTTNPCSRAVSRKALEKVTRRPSKLFWAFRLNTYSSHDKKGILPPWV